MWRIRGRAGERGEGLSKTGRRKEIWCMPEVPDRVCVHMCMHMYMHLWALSVCMPVFTCIHMCICLCIWSLDWLTQKRFNKQDQPPAPVLQTQVGGIIVLSHLFFSLLLEPQSSPHCPQGVEISPWECLQSLLHLDLPADPKRSLSLTPMMTFCLYLCGPSSIFIWKKVCIWCKCGNSLNVYQCGER